MRNTTRAKSLKEENVVRVLSRNVVGHHTLLRLSNGKKLAVRRFFPAGQGDHLKLSNQTNSVYVKHEDIWLPIGKAWTASQSVDLGRRRAEIVFKEIETAEELKLFEGLRKFHYRGGGGAGRTVPLIATSDVWDLPSVLGFIEISSSMIANTARKHFFNLPYFEPDGPSWKSWNRVATKKYSSIVCRISRFVIHPEIRGLGLAKAFSEAARHYSRDRWHYGGFRPRFLEITADMLRYYKFIDRAFAYMGETEGNEHRLSKDMIYLVKKALSEGDEMPQGGGGIMTLQRGYASQLMRYLETHKKSLPDVVRSLRHDPQTLDQVTWESLYRLNRRPKPSYSSGLTPTAEKYVEMRRTAFQSSPEQPAKARNVVKTWSFQKIGIQATTTIAQSSEARHLQDTFGFVGASLSSDIVQNLSFKLTSGQLTLVCGASGSGKSLFARACSNLLGQDGKPNMRIYESATLEVQGSVSDTAKVVELSDLPMNKTPLDLKGRSSLEQFLQVTAKCGLAEPQLFVRPVHSLSSGQRYRLRVALAFLANPNIIVVDNFCEPLDRYTSIAVVRGIKRLAVEYRVAVLAATASYDRLRSLSDIDQTILLRRGDRAIVSRKRGRSEL